MDDQRLVRHRIVIGREAVGVVPAAAAHLVGRFVEDVEDVRGLAVADLDAERIDQDQLVDAMAAGGGDLGREPAAKREAEHGDLVARQRVAAPRGRDGRDRKPCRNRCGRGELPNPGADGATISPCRPSRSRNGASAIDRVEAVQQQHRAPCAAAQHFEFDPLHRQPIGPGLPAGHRNPSLRPSQARGFITSIAAGREPILNAANRPSGGQAGRNRPPATSRPHHE